MTYLYMYRMTSDTGFAPCVDNGLLSLACCKGGKIVNGRPIHTGLRYWIGSKRDGADPAIDDVYVLGTYKNKFLYLARINNIVTMTEYFNKMADKRLDRIYSLAKGKLVRNQWLRDKGIHVEPEQNQRDTAGEYVLLSDDFIYLGEDAPFVDIVNNYGAERREIKLYKGDIAERIISECLKYRDNKKHEPTTPIKKNCGG